MARSDTRQAILRAGAGLITRHGFGATGINAVLAAAGVPKGSFYHYFASKHDFGLALIDTYAADHEARLTDVLGDTAASPLQRLRNYFAAGITDMASHQCAEGCLIGNLGQELAAQDEAFRARLDAVFARWEALFAECLEAAREAGEIHPGVDPRELAAFLLAGWEGAILRAKVIKSVTPMQRFESVLFERILHAA